MSYTRVKPLLLKKWVNRETRFFPTCSKKNGGEKTGLPGLNPSKKKQRKLPKNRSKLDFFSHLWTQRTLGVKVQLLFGPFEIDDFSFVIDMFLIEFPTASASQPCYKLTGASRRSA